MKNNMMKVIRNLKDPKCYIMITNEGMATYCRGDELLTMLTMAIKQVADQIPKEEILRCVEFAYMRDDKFDKMLDKIEKLMKEIEELGNE